MIRVIVPQIGQSIAEATIVKWFKKPGERIEKGETLVEIGTDKVNTEIPAPESGVITELLAKQDEVVPVGAEIAVIRNNHETVEQETARAAVEPAEPAQLASHSTVPKTQTEGARHSPVVRKLAQENNINLNELQGSGEGGRITREDVLRAVEGRTKGETIAESRSTRRVPMSRVRKLIAEHMTLSRRTAADVTTFFEIDMHQVVAERDRAREILEKQYNVKLTYLPFIIDAVVKALKEFPVLNSTIDGEDIIYKEEVHVGIAVAMEDGLVVPVIRNADRKSVLELARAAQDLSNRARTRRLAVEDLENGTFTITNPGVFGALMGTPIIHQPQVAILGVGAIVKRPVVVQDNIVIRPMSYFSLSYDHRALDGSTADGFLAHIKQTLEQNCARVEA
jgi:2-oxoglutarate dehydrogenase E2 component (dihydrolipoamide succinyltransferase)/2-oxoisovalerate dehydrogenase E2 component (dihydrolipoyl transacylase)